jgi:hypothetical protein
VGPHWLYELKDDGYRLMVPVLSATFWTGSEVARARIAR